MLARDQDINHAISKMIDILYLSIFINRVSVKLFPRATRHISQNIRYTRGEVIRTLESYQLNDVEVSAFDKLEQLYKAVSAKGEASSFQIPRVFHSESELKVLLSRVTSEHYWNDVIEYTNLVLAVLGQFDYKFSSSVLPFFSIHPSGTGYYRKLAHLGGTKANFDRSVPVTPSTAWYRMFGGLILNKAKQPRENISELFSILNIDHLPDRASGIGITRFPVTSLFSNTSSYLKQHQSELIDVADIYLELRKHNPDLMPISGNYYNDNMQSGWAYAVEAAEDKPEETEEEPEEEADPKEEPEEETSDTDDEPEESGEETSDEDDSEDPEEPGEDDEETPDTPEDESGEDTEHESNKTKSILGLNIKLAKDETLDDYLYKIKTLNYIDNAIEFNHDDLSADTVTLLKYWKNYFLFLASVEETEKLFKSLQIEHVGV